MQNEERGLLPAVEYLPLVRKVAQRLVQRLPRHILVDDLLGSGVVGLLEAMERFDQNRATAFESYAEFRVRGAMLDELRRRDLMARDARLAAKNFKHVSDVLTLELGREPHDDELAVKMGIDLETFHRKRERLLPVRVFSLSETREETMALEGSVSPYEAMAQKQRSQRLSAAVAQLSERYQHALHLYYAEDMTLKEIGQVMHVSESRVCQILASSTMRLRGLLKGES